MIFANFASLLPTDTSALESSISALEGSISALESSTAPLVSELPFWEYFGFVSAALVVIGVLLELHDVRDRHGEDETIWALSFFGVSKSLEKPRFIKKYGVELASVILVAGGVAGEVGAGLMIESKNSALRAIDIKLRSANSELRNKTGQLIALITKESEQLRKDAGQLHKDAETEHLARVRIEAGVAWRTLSDQDKRDIGAALTGFKSLAAVGLWFNSSSTEDELFADDIAEALRTGGIVTNAPGGIIEMRESSGKFGEPVAKATTGVRVQSTKDDTARRFAAAFIAELNRRGFDADRQKDPPFGESKIPQIWVTVEPRPKGPQGEYKLQAEGEAKIKSASKSKH